MTIKSKEELGLCIDLTGPEGNAHNVLACARQWGTQLGYDVEKIQEEMKSSDYDNLIEVFDSYFGELVTIYR